MDTFRKALVFCVLGLVFPVVELTQGGRTKISDADSLDMDSDLNQMSNDELRLYGDALYLRMAKAQGATEVIAFLTDLFQGKKVPIQLEDIRDIFRQLTSKFLDPALKTRNRLEALNVLWQQRVSSTPM